MKILVFYATTLAMLFGSLTVLFNALGVGSAESPPAQQAESAESATSANEPEVLPPPVEKPIVQSRFPGIEHPFLLPRRYYSVAQPITLYSERTLTPMRVESLPPQGVFRVQARIEATDTLWYRVGVSDGQRNFTFFVPAHDLNSAGVERYYPSGRPAPHEEQEDQQARMAMGDFDLDIKPIRINMYGDSSDRPDQAAAPDTTSSPPAASLDDSIRSGLSVFNAQGWLSASLLAGVVTLFTAGVLGMVAWYRVTHRWSSGRQIEALWTDDAPDMDEPSEEPVRQARIAHEPAEKNRNLFE